jgi:hypothetical protein
VSTPAPDVADAARRRSEIRVEGRVASLRLSAEGAAPNFEVELQVDKQVVQLVWLGRRAIPGIRPGTRLAVRGRPVRWRRGTALVNPMYELLP